MGSLNPPAGGLVYVDTAILIYLAEKHARCTACLRPLWDSMAAGTTQVLTSELTRLEVLVRPMRLAQTLLVAEYRRILTATELLVEPVTRRVLDQAAQLRATHHALRTPDAIHLATAVVTGCDTFLSNDRRLQHVSPLPITILEDVLASP